MTKKIIFFAACMFAWVAFMPQTQEKPTPVIRLDTIYAEPPDPVASYLIESRWECVSDGCADHGAIGRIAKRIREASEKHGIPVSMLVGVLMVEDPWLDTLAVSRAGAIGLFQVMPFHRNAWDCNDPMRTVAGSVCRGAAILSDMFRRHGNEQKALLGYNGCLSEYCQSYHEKVVAKSEDFEAGL